MFQIRGIYFTTKMFSQIIKKKVLAVLFEGV